MEKKQINKTNTIKTNVCKETKSAFLAKLRSIECNESSLFLAFLLDIWTKREKISDDSRARSFKILFSLMPANVPYNIMKIGDSILVYKYSKPKAWEWIREMEQAAKLSEYNTVSAVCRNLMYAVILAPSKLLIELRYNYVANNIGLTKFESAHLFRFNINEEIYDNLYDMYGISPNALIYILIKIILDENADTRKILLDNINLTPKKHNTQKGGKRINVKVNNDLFRLNILQLMIDLGFSTKSGFAHALIELAMKSPRLIKEGLSSESYQMDNIDDEYQLENDMFKHMANLYYKFNGQ